MFGAKISSFQTIKIMKALKVIYKDQIEYQIMMDLNIKVLALTLLIVTIRTDLQVYSPSCATKQFNNTIKYTLSNFGEIPYGQTIIGKIHIPNQKMLCNITGKNQTKFFKKTSVSESVIFLVQRGICKFTQKVINAQNLGADVVIIYDNMKSFEPNVIMKNDGHGHLAKIPSLLISKNDGQNLKRLVGLNCIPSLKLRFQIEQKQISDVILWLDAGNRQTYILARQFHKVYYDIIADYINFEVKFRVDTCHVIGIDLDSLCTNTNCFGKKDNGACRYFQDSQVKANGYQLIVEQLRQYYLLEQLKKSKQIQKWWSYMVAFDRELCLSEKDIEGCSKDQMKSVGVSESQINSVNNQIVKLQAQMKQGKTGLINNIQNQAQELNIYFYPEATINNRNFYGLFKAPEVFEMICDSLLKPPKECITFIKNNHKFDTSEGETQSIWPMILLILLLMSAGFTLALYIYTRFIRTEINQQLSIEVNKMVQNYVTLGEKSTGSSYNKLER